MGLSAPVRILRAELEALDELAMRGVQEGEATLAPLRVLVNQLASIERERGEIMDALECLESGGFEMGEWRSLGGAGLIFAEANATLDLFERPGGRA